MNKEKKRFFCVFCKTRLRGNQRKYCSNSCKCKEFYKQHPAKCNAWIKKHPKPKVNNDCLTCGNKCGGKRYCSDICKPVRQPSYWKDLEILNAQCKTCKGTILMPHVHHINGNHRDNRRENLIVLCPSCHVKIHKPKLLKNKKRTTKLRMLDIEAKLDKLRQKLNV